MNVYFQYMYLYNLSHYFMNVNEAYINDNVLLCLLQVLKHKCRNLQKTCIGSNWIIAGNQVQISNLSEVQTVKNNLNQRKKRTIT